MRRYKKIGILGPFGSGNLGDAAIQDAVIFNLKRKLPNVTIVGFSANPIDTELRHHIKSYDITNRHRESNFQFNKKLRTKNKNPFFHFIEKIIAKLIDYYYVFNFLGKSVKIARQLDLLIFSGGGQLDDYWGGAWAHPFSIFRWSLLAKMFNARVVFLSVGVDSIKFKLSKFFIKNSLLISDYRSFRENNSSNFVRDLGIRHHNHVYPDLAFSYPIPEACYMQHPKVEKNTIIGISPIASSAWILTDEDKVYNDYLDSLISLTEFLVKEDYKVIFFPSQEKMDVPVIEHIKSQLASRIKSGAIDYLLPQGKLKVDDLLLEISKLDLIIASRLHGVLLSLLLSKPVLAISYNKKVNKLMHDMGLESYSIDLECCHTGVLIERLTSLQFDKKKIEKQITDKVAEYRELLEQQYNQILSLSNDFSD